MEGFLIAPLHHTDAAGACSCGDPACASPGKHPLHSGWREHATDDPLEIEEIFRAHPGLNYAVCPQDDQVIVDLDVGGDKDGIAAWKALQAEAGEPSCEPDTLVVRTQSGGEHWYFKAPYAVGNANTFPDGVDVRGRGGYVLGPYSEVAGRVYKPVTTVQPCEAPPWVLSHTRRPNEKAEDREAKYELDTDGAIRMARNFLRVRPPAIEGQGGHDHTYATACMVIDRGISAAKCLDLMMEAWNETCQPPWDADELAVVVGNAWRYRNRPPGDKGGDILMDMADVPIPEDAVDASTLDFDALDAIEEAGSRPRRSFVPMSEDDLDTMPPPRWLVEDVLEEGTLVMFYGAEQSYKSFVVIDLTLSVAAGLSWPDKEPDRQSPLTTIYIAGEGARGVGTDRRRAWRHAHEVADRLPFYLIPEMPHVQDATDVIQLVRDIESVGIKPDIIVIDTVVRAMVGLNENDAKDTGLLVDACDHIQRHFGCVVIAVHHTGKDETKGARGSSNLPASFSARFRVEADRDSREVTVINEKQKDADTWPTALRGTAEEVYFTEGRKSLVFTEFKRQTARMVADETRGRQVALARVLHELSLRHKDEAYGGKPTNKRMSRSSVAEQLSIIMSTEIEDLDWKARIVQQLDAAGLGNRVKPSSFSTGISELMPTVDKDPRGVAVTDVDDPYVVRLKREGRHINIYIDPHAPSALDDAPMGAAVDLSDEVPIDDFESRLEEL